MTRLYELQGAYAEVQARAEAGEDVSDALAQLSDAIELKSSALVRLLRDLDLDKDKLSEEIERLAARKKTAEANIKRIREYVRSCMAGAGVERLKAGTFAITLSEGQEVVQVVDEAAVPPEYLRTRTETSVDKAAVLAAYKRDGECVAGTRVERCTRLTIR